MTLKEFYKQHVTDAAAGLRKAKPDYASFKTSEKDILEHHLKQRELSNLRNTFSRNLALALRKLSDDQLNQIFNKLKTEQGRSNATAAYFRENIRKDPPSAFLNPSFFGCGSVDQILDAYQEALGPQAVQGVIDAPIPPLPVGKDYKAPTVQPFQKELGDLRRKHAGDNDALSLLRDVERALEDIDPNALQQINNIYKGSVGDDFLSLDTVQELRQNLLKKEGLRLLDDGRFQNRIVPEFPPKHGAPYFNDESDLFDQPLSEEDRTKLLNYGKDNDAGLSQEARDVLSSMGKQLDQLDFTGSSLKLYSSRQFAPKKPASPDARIFTAEQGTKYYAFWPLIRAKELLGEAVRKGDLAQIRRCMDAYTQTEKVIDKLFQDLNGENVSADPLFPANMESTREENGLLPAKYAVDFVAQNKLNGVSAFYGALKNADLTIDDLINDPVGALQTMADRYLDNAKLDGRPENIGAALQAGLKGNNPMGPAEALQDGWNNMIQAIGRGISSVAGIEKDPERRARFLAQVQLGTILASNRVREEEARYKMERKVINGRRPAAYAMRSVIYQTAALAPEKGEDRFNLGKLIDDFSKPRELNQQEIELLGPEEPPAAPVQESEDEPDYANRHSWRDGKADIESRIYGEKQVNFAELAERNEKVIRQARQEQQLSGSFTSEFDPDLYLVNAFSAQSRLLQNAGGAAQQDPDFERFRTSVHNTWTHASRSDAKTVLHIGAELLKDPSALDFLHTDKQDQLSKRDSEEYRDMKESLEKLQSYRQILESGDPVKLEKLCNSSAVKDLENAKANAFRYVQLKTKSGTKAIGTFHYESGNRRVREGLANYEKLCKLQDALGLRSPAEKLYDDARQTLMLNRWNDNWIRENGMRYVGAMIHAQSMLQAGWPRELQEKNVQPNALNNAIRAFTRKLSPNMTLASKLTLADSAIKNKEEFLKHCRRGAATMKQQFETVNAETLRHRAEKEMCRGYSMDLAALELNIASSEPNYNDNYQVIQRRAAEIRRRPEFREIMQRLAAGKTAEQLRELHGPALHPSGIDNPAWDPYYRTKHALDYEKRCAELAAERYARFRNQGEPDEKTVADTASALRKDPRFQAYIREQLQNVDTNDIPDLVRGLTDPETQTLVRDQICQRVGQQLQPEAEHEPQRENNLILSQNLQNRDGPELRQGGPLQ